MTIFDSMRRDLLRTGGLGVAAVGFPVASLAAAQQPSSGEVPSAIFDVRKFGATGSDVSKLAFLILMEASRAADADCAAASHD